MPSLKRKDWFNGLQLYSEIFQKMEIFHDLAIRCRRITPVRLFRTLALHIATPDKNTWRTWSKIQIQDKEMQIRIMISLKEYDHV